MHFLDYEVACNRKVLLTEHSLYFPVWDFLQSSSDLVVCPEEPSPALRRKKKGKLPKLDYALKNTQGRIAEILEVKYQKEIHLKQDLFNDIVRVGALIGNLERYILVAGNTSFITHHIIDVRGNVGAGQRRDFIFKNFLPETKDQSITTRIRDQINARTSFFRASAQKYNLSIPRSIQVSLPGKFISTVENGHSCYVWKIRKMTLPKLPKKQG